MATDAMNKIWWCKSHRREATHSLYGKYHCDPRLGGLLIPCDAELMIMKSGIKLIEEERIRQMDKEGWTAKHDDEHDAGVLAIASMCYAAYAGNLLHPFTQGDGDWSKTTPPEWWPFDLTDWKPTDDPRKALVKAGALIAAEIDRMNRAQIREENGPQA